MYVFGSCELDPARFELRHGGTAVHLQPQVFSVLCYLLEHRHRVVPKSELPDAVWGDRFVSDSTLSSRVKAARRAIGDDGASQQLIAGNTTARSVGGQFHPCPTGSHPSVAGNTRGLPGRGASHSPSGPFSRYRRRHLRTVSGQMASRRAISLFPAPPAASSTIRVRSTNRCGAVARRDSDSSSARSPSPRQ